MDYLSSLMEVENYQKDDNNNKTNLSLDEASDTTRDAAQLYMFCLLPAGQTQTTEPEVLFEFCSPVLPLLLSEGAAVAVGHLLPLLDVRGGGRNDKFSPVNPHHVWVAGVIEHGHGRSDDLTYRAG